MTEILKTINVELKNKKCLDILEEVVLEIVSLGRIEKEFLRFVFV